MRRKLSLILTLSAWLLATGSHWDLVQTFAWGRMLVTYSQSMPLLKAVERTFSSDGMCGVCYTVADAKQNDSASDASNAGATGKSPGKIFLVFAAVDSPLIVASAAPSAWSPSDHVSSTADRAAPPLPPPRSLA